MDRKIDLTRRQLLAVLLLASIGGVAWGQSTERASVDSSGVEGDGMSLWTSLSADGRFVAFSSLADNLVPFDTNRMVDVFVRDLATGVTERVSVSSAGVEGDGVSHWPSISDDGRFVAFTSSATNLVPGDTNTFNDIFVHDRKHATTWRVSVDSAGIEADFPSYELAISGDGRVVVFESDASNLVAGDTNHVRDVFVHDNVTGATERVSVDNSGTEGDLHSWQPQVSSDGDRIVFASNATNLVVGDTNAQMDIFLHERSSASTTRVSFAWNGAEATGACYVPDISADGDVIAFSSDAPNLVANDLNAATDVFVVDLARGSLTRVSVDSSGAEGNGKSTVPYLAANGRFVAYVSGADNLVAGDANQVFDVFEHDRKFGITWRASIAGDGSEGDSNSFCPSIGGSGLQVTFLSDATNLVSGDTNGEDDVFVRSEAAADWTNYGPGFAGTLGIPELVAQDVPTLGTAVSVDVGNSAGVFTQGLLAVGFDRANLPIPGNGTLLVDVAFWLPLGIPDLGLTLVSSLPNDPLLSGFVVDVQLLELDAGAAKGISFSRGLELVLGR